MLVTSTEAIRILERRGFSADREQIDRWCRTKLLRGATRASYSGWLIPEESLNSFMPKQTIHVAHHRRDIRLERAEQGDLSAYQQPWADAYFAAIRDADDEHALERAAITEAERAHEFALNSRFGEQHVRLWKRRWHLEDDGDRITCEPRPIAMADEIHEHRQNLDSDSGVIFDRAIAQGYMIAPLDMEDVAGLWWEWCVLHNHPYIVQRQHRPNYTHLEIDIWMVIERNGEPRTLPLSAYRDIYLLERDWIQPKARQRRDEDSGRLETAMEGQQVSQPSQQENDGNRDRYSNMYLMWTNDNLAQHLLSIYRRYFSTDPPQNPEQHPNWMPRLSMNMDTVVMAYKSVGLL